MNELYNKIGIYKILNIKNYKFYIGSAKNLYSRKRDHFSALKNNRHCNKYLQSSFNKYGEENFEFEVVEYCKEENLIEREQYYLDLYKSYNKEIGYNISKIAYAVLTENTIVPVCQYNLEGKFIKVWNSIKDYAGNDVALRNGISANCRGLNKTAYGYRWMYYDKDNFVYDLGKIKYDYKAPNHTKEGRKITEQSLYKPIVQFDKEGNFIKEWPSASIAAKELGLRSGDIRATCRKFQKSSGGFQWCEKGEEGAIKKYKNDHLTEIVQLDLGGNFIKKWNTIKSASNFYNICEGSILQCLSGVSKKSNGYKWKLYEDWKKEKELINI